MSKEIVSVASIKCGSPQLFLIAGPCVIEKESIMMETATELRTISDRLKLPVIFKSSFIKDNRSLLSGYYGPGLEEGLKLLEKIKKEFNFPILSDVHNPNQVPAAAEVLDVIQIPAYLCMQTSLLVAAAKTGKVVNIKHGQFLAPENMKNPASKVVESGNKNIILTERGYTFGYNDLVVDPRSFYWMAQTGFPVVFDIKHSIRRYGIASADPRGGSPEFIPTLARAGVAAGVDGIFIETHPDPPKALCDAASQYPLPQLEKFLQPLIELHNLVSNYK